MKMHGGPQWLTIVASFVAAAGLWYWAVAIYAPSNTTRAQSAGRPIGNNSDLYARWYGTRELLLRGRNPYSPEVTREIQMGFYGRALDPANENDPKQQEGFAYPLYVAFLIAPLAYLPFSTAQRILCWLLLAAIAASVPLWELAVGGRMRQTSLFAATILAFGSYPAVMEFYQQNLAALVIFLIAAAVACVARGWLLCAGFLLSLTTIKPEISGLMIAWLLFWSLANLRERGKLALSFGVALAALVLSAELLLPHWVDHFLRSLREYAATETDPSILRVIFPTWLATVSSAALLILLAWVGWRARRSKAGSEQFSWTVALVGSSTLVLIPKFAAYNQLILVPVLLMFASHWQKIRESGMIARALSKATFAAQSWQWAAALALAVASVALPSETIRRAASLPLATLLALPVLSTLAVLVVGTQQQEQPGT